MTMKHIVLASAAIMALSAPAIAADPLPWGYYSTTHSNYPTGNDARRRSHDEYWARQRLEERQREHLAQEARAQEERREHMNDRKHKNKHVDNGNHYGQKKHPNKAKHDNRRRGHNGRR